MKHHRQTAFNGRGCDRNPRKDRGNAATKLSFLNQLKAEEAELQNTLGTRSLLIVEHVRTESRLAAVQAQIREITKGQ